VPGDRGDGHPALRPFSSWARGTDDHLGVLQVIVHVIDDA
jgi:hypothetical protein